MNCVIKSGQPIPVETCNAITTRLNAITRAINQEFWNIHDDQHHSIFVGSYGRGTAISTSDVDVLVDLPRDEYYRFDRYKGNGQSRLLQAVKDAIQNTYPNTDIRADGQVVKVNFSDNIKFEVLPAFSQNDGLGNIIFRYPDTNMGGNWLSTNPLTEQKVMKDKNISSNGLLFDTCQHMRFIRNKNFSSYKLSGIVIDSFVYKAIEDWSWPNISDTTTSKHGDYENHLYNYYLNNYKNQKYIFAPGSYTRIDFSDNDETLEKVLRKMID
ncbi:nucleotidyltransferase domain-containing protein [bacterium]|nr:nucleotidyltransferase domain-containing protein [bacterium]